MIIKLRVPARPFAKDGTGGWTYLQGVERVDTHETPTQDDGSARAFTREGLIQFVDDCWGPSGLRQFDYEVWPQDMHDEWCRFAAVAVAHLTGGRMALLVMTEDCYLLGENGQTVDRLCASGLATIG